MKKITLSSTFNFESGYEEILKTLLEDLPLYNYGIIPRSYSTINPKFRKYFENNEFFKSNVDLLLLNIVNEFGVGNPYLHLQFDRPRILYTMWESTRLNDLLIEIINKFNCIIVPNEYNKFNLINQGCTTRIEVVPLFCDTKHYVYKTPNNKDEFVFGISNEDFRKKLDKIQNCFIKAFSKNKNVKLKVKTINQSHLNKFINSNITYVNKKYSSSELRDWYYDLDVYISGVTCEGWGMMQQESMCCGRPIIFTNYGGLKEFVNKNNGFEVKYQEVFAESCWGNSAGKWSEFDENDMIEKMLYVYNNRQEVIEKGILAAKDASQFTKERFLKKIDEILTEYI